MTKPILELDCDGVLADLHAMFLNEIVVEVTGRLHSIDECNTWHFKDCILTDAEDKACWALLNARPYLIAHLEKLPLAKALPALRKRANVRCVTAMFGPTMPHRVQWLLGLGFTEKDIVFAADKSLVQGDWLVDDKIRNCIEWGQANPLGQAILLEAPYNVPNEAEQEMLDMLGILRLGHEETIAHLLEVL